MNLQLWLWLTSHLATFAIGLQALEILLLSRSKNFAHVWSYQNLKYDLETGVPLPNPWIRNLFSITGLKTICVLQLILSLAAFIWPNPWLFAGLLITHLYICVRFRGTFNGGSDMMAFVVLTGLILSLSSQNENLQKLGMIYISIHTLYSYFKAGLVKVIHKDWHSGKALPGFLERSLFDDIKQLSKWMRSHPNLSRTLGWLVLAFELSVPLILLFPLLIFPFFLIASLFHFINYTTFGLNRFFWIWLAAWPAVLYSVGLIAP